MIRTATRTLGVLLIAIGLLLGARTGWVVGGAGDADARLAAQVAFLDAALTDGRAVDMQELFPEGAFFMTALTASAGAASATLPPERVRALRDDLDSPEHTAVFGTGMVPEHGIFHAGWSLLVANDLASATGSAADLRDVERRAEVVATALAGSRSGFLAGYPGSYWPCDTVVAAAELARSAVLLDRPDWLREVRRWRDRVARHRDPTTGLLPHRVDASGVAIEGPRGSSQSIIQAFWPGLTTALDGQVDTSAYRVFVTWFVTREAGLVGVRDHLMGSTGTGDVDSGPLLLGVSASASTVGLAAARAAGDRDLARDLDREADLLGLPWQWSGQRRYAGGVLPVGDAFLAWSRSRPAPGVIESVAPRARWVLPVSVAVLALVLGAFLLVLGAARRTRSGRTTSR